MSRVALTGVALVLAGIAAYLAYAFTVAECVSCLPQPRQAPCGAGTALMGVLSGFGALTAAALAAEARP